MCFNVIIGLLTAICIAFVESHGAAQKKKSNHRAWSSLFYAPTASWCKASSWKQDHTQRLEAGQSFPQWKHGTENWRFWPRNKVRFWWWKEKVYDDWFFEFIFVSLLNAIICFVGLSVALPITLPLKSCAKKVTVMKWIFGLWAAFCKLNVNKSMFWMLTIFLCNH